MKDENLAFAIRGKTDRRRTRDAKKKIEKQMIQLDKKASQLYYLERNLGNELLETPYQKGFKRFFEVRKDITQTKYVDFYTELLAIINTTQYSLRKDFKKSKKIKRKRVLVETTQALKSFSEWEFKKIPEKFKFHFIKIEEYSALTKSIEINYVFIESWKYNLKVVPNIITHRKKLDNELASEIKNIENKIERNDLRIKINKAKSKYTNYKNWKVADNKKQKPIYQLIKEENERH